MAQATTMNQIRIEDFEKYHASRMRRPQPRASLKEVLSAVLLATIVSPFMYVIFFCIPIIGIVTVGFAGFVTTLYLFFRRSIVLWLTTILTCGALAGIFFSVIQSVKYRLDVTLFVLIALGIPVTLIFTTFVGMKIWEIRGGGE